MVTCAIVGCHNKQGIHLGVRFFGIPTVITNQCAKTLELSRRRRAQWVARINRKEITENTVRKHHKVCGKHFVQGHPSSLFDSNNQDWVPSLDLGYENPPENRSDGRLPLHKIQPQNQNGADHLDPLLEVYCGSSCVTEENQATAQHPTGVESLCSPQEDPLFVISEVFSESSNVPEEKAVEFVNLSIKVEDDIMSDEPSAKHVSARTCPSVVASQQLTDTSVEACSSVTDASVQARICCDELGEMRMEREALVQNVVGLNAELSESAYEVKSFDNSLVEKNFILAEKNLKISELEAKRKKLEVTYLSCLKTCDELKSSISKVSLNEDSLKNDDKKVSFYTGLHSFVLLMMVFNLVNEKVKNSGAYALPKFQQFVMVLMWLKLGLEEQDLAYRFDVSQATVSRILHRWLIPMSYALERFIVWPDRETQQTSLPFCFQGNWNKAVAVIIDWFEVFIRSPSSVLAKAGSSSQYEHHKTAKFLIGITPQGKVSFISKAWVGHISVKHITEHCGLLDKLLPGDVVMADRGFDIAESAGIIGARLVIPDLTKGTPQLSFDDLELSRQIANVRNHVEKVIGLVRRKYQILSTTLPVNFLTKIEDDDLAPIDHVARVCCALTNLSLSVVPLE